MNHPGSRRTEDRDEILRTGRKPRTAAEHAQAAPAAKLRVLPVVVPAVVLGAVLLYRAVL